jgi:calcium release-activated calcium channel protein 1
MSLVWIFAFAAQLCFRLFSQIHLALMETTTCARPASRQCLRAHPLWSRAGVRPREYGSERQQPRVGGCAGASTRRVTPRAHHPRVSRPLSSSSILGRHATQTHHPDPRIPPHPLVQNPTQAFLTALDTSLSRTWRDEERGWRVEDKTWRGQDMDFRVEERDWWHLEHLWRQENRKWRKEDVEQRVLENARWIWLRYAEKNRRDVEEKSEQLKSISNLSALIAGFAVVAFVELQVRPWSFPKSRTTVLPKLVTVVHTSRYTILTFFLLSQFHDPLVAPTHVHELLIVAYATTTALVVALMLNSMVLCSFMLCSILRNGKTYVSEVEEGDYLFACRRFAVQYKQGDTPPTPKRSFEKHWELRCEDDWKHAFRMFTCGVPVFLINIACVAWLKFWYSPLAAGATTAVAVVATMGWAHTQNNWGWHIARGGHGREGHPNVVGSSSSNSDGATGLPFAWHARPPSNRRGFARGGFRNQDEEEDEGREAGTGGARGTHTPVDAVAVVVDANEEGDERGVDGDDEGGERGVEAYASSGEVATGRDDVEGPAGEYVSHSVSHAEGAFVRRASPRARDIARRASPTNNPPFAVSRDEDPFVATASALLRSDRQE